MPRPHFYWRVRLRLNQPNHLLSHIICLLVITSIKMTINPSLAQVAECLFLLQAPLVRQDQRSKIPKAMLELAPRSMFQWSTKMEIPYLVWKRNNQKKSERNSTTKSILSTTWKTPEGKMNYLRKSLFTKTQFSRLIV